MTNETKRFLEEPVYFNCPHCGTLLKIKLKEAGVVVICRECKQEIKTPSEINVSEDLADLRHELQGK